MKRLPLVLTALIIPVTLGVAVAASAAPDTPAPAASPYYGGPCPGYAQGMGPGRAMGMRAGRGQGWGMGPGGRRANWGSGPGPMRSDDFRAERRAFWADANHDGTLTVDEVKAFLAARHDGPWFENLKIGAVKEKDDSTITADIVTKDGSLVHTLEFPVKVNAAAIGPQRGYGFGPGMRGGRHGFGGQGRGFGGRGHGFGPMQASSAGGFHAGMTAGLLADGHLSVDEVKGLVEHRLAIWNNPNLKLGKVEEKDATTISADIVTKDGSLVQTLEFDSKTARLLPTR